MSGPGPRSRGNGLVAGAYVALVECDPRLADTLLAALARAGVAAYVAPSPGRVGGYLDVRLPGRPVDRVYVDASRRPLAEQVMATELPPEAEIADLAGLPEVSDLAGPASADGGSGPAGRAGDGPAAEVDFDAEFAEIVAAFGSSWPEPPAGGRASTASPPPAGAATGPARSALPPPLPPAPPTGAAPSGPARPTGEGPPKATSGRLPSSTGPRDWTPGPEDDDGHYEPPDPLPIPSTNPVTRWAWAALTLGLLLVLSPVVPALHAGAGEQLAGIFAILGGVGTLVWRLRDSHDPDDPDDGAVV